MATEPASLASRSSLASTTLAALASDGRPDDDARTLGDLAGLLDRSDIATLVHRLGAALDEARFERFATIFTADVTVQTPGGVAEGLDAVVTQAARNHSATQGIQHTIGDVLVDLDRSVPDRAEVRANLVVTFADPLGGVGVHRRMGSVYGFQARRTAEGWRLSSVTTTVIWDERAA
jgi:hypothetical protein